MRCSGWAGSSATRTILTRESADGALAVYLLDTDHIAILQRQPEPAYSALTRRMDEHPVERFFISVASFHEQAVGCHGYLNRQRREDDIIRGYSMFLQLLSTFATYTVLPYDKAAAGAFRRIRNIQIGTMDLRIAATALSRDFTVLSRNTVHFGRVPGLRVEDWTVA